LTDYCNREKIKIDLFFGPNYTNGQKRSEENEGLFDFMALRPVLERIIK
jgi:hypothetical protein